MSAAIAERLARAEKVAAIARELGIETALIGALALAVHKHVRATNDVDLASAVAPSVELPKLERALRAAGLRAKLRLPDDDDPLGGVVVVWEREDDDGDPIDPIEIVNFVNPLRPRRNPGRAAIERAIELEGLALRCVRLSDLVALKLDAGSRQDLADVVDLLVANPDADLDEIRTVAMPFDAKGELETLIAEAIELRGR
ncbi:MAG TPA: hypothetical protein VL463_19310 [Kofleriaceae bacterium]|jgi:hypothetical protein|nr:hypothetical protein [Kofleriaceae bacterium]